MGTAFIVIGSILTYIVIALSAWAYTRYKHLKFTQEHSWYDDDDVYIGAYIIDFLWPLWPIVGVIYWFCKGIYFLGTKADATIKAKVDA